MVPIPLEGWRRVKSSMASLLSEGRELPARDPKVKERKTTPKKRFTEYSLLSAMESVGAKEKRI